MKDSLALWEKKCLKYPTYTELMTKSFQQRLANLYPAEGIKLMTLAVRQMCEATLAGSEFMGYKVYHEQSLMEQDRLAADLTERYRQLVTVEGLATGAGGLLTGLADFPLFLSMKMRYLHELAGIYGFDASHYGERIYMLYIFQLTFSSSLIRRKTFLLMQAWPTQGKDVIKQGEWDWQTFQQEYRDAIDLAKLFQLVPGIGGAVGAVVNHSLFSQLAINGQQAYHMRLMHLQQKDRL